MGGIDILVDNAASQTRVPDGVLAMSDADWLTDLSGTLLSAVRLDRELLPTMIAQRSGAIVHIGSGAGRWPQPAALAYAAAKAALTTYSKGLANQGGPHGIRVDVVTPGVIETAGLATRLQVLAEENGTDLDIARRTFSAEFGISFGRVGQPDEVAELVTFLASHVPGTVHVIDGGLLPPCERAHPGDAACPLSSSGIRQSTLTETPEEATVTLIIETDDRSRVVIPGHHNERFVVRENADGSLLLQPARVVTEAQVDYDSDPELRALLTRVSQSPTVRRRRVRR